MRYLLTESSRRIARASNRINKVFGARYRWTILYKASDYAYVYKYVYRNPVRASICLSVENYPYSTLTHLLRGECEIPICDRIDNVSHMILKNPIELLSWLNKPTDKEIEKLIGRALRRFEFKFTTDNRYQKNLRFLQAGYGVV